MNEHIRSLVPAIDLCKFIPTGEFSQAALIYYRATISGDYIVLPKLYKNVDLARIICPAPTLSEILAELVKHSKRYAKVVPLGVHFDFYYFYFEHHRWNFTMGEINHNSENLVDAAMKLWLERNGIEVKV